MKRAIRYLIALWFLSRIVYLFYAEFGSAFWDELYWFTNWAGLIYFTFLIRKLLKLTNLSQATVKTLRSELFKLGLLFVSLFLFSELSVVSLPLSGNELKAKYRILL